MTRSFSVVAFATGLLVIASMAASVVAGDMLTLLVMLLITAAYVVGGIELLGFQRDTQALNLAMGDLPPINNPESTDRSALNTWLSRIPAGLRQSVQQRLSGEHVGLPAPVLTPYLVGLLVMLGLMGTFVGMVATLGGAVQALEGGTELSAIRDGLAAPIRGLGMAFGTSVAGVAASAMLGLIATLSRRDRLTASRRLEALREGPFKQFSLVHQRQQTYQALQQQATALPVVADSLVELTARLALLGEQLETTSRRSAEQLLAQQKCFEAGVQEDFRALTGSVAKTLETSLAGVGKQTAETLHPQVQQLLQHGADQLADAAAANTAALSTLHNEMRAQQAEHRDARQALEQQWLSSMSENARLILEGITQVQEQLLTQQLEAKTALQESESQWRQTMAEHTQSLLQGLSDHQSETLRFDRAQQASRTEAEAGWQRAIADSTESLITSLAEHREQLLAGNREQEERRRQSDEAWQAVSAQRGRELIDGVGSGLAELTQSLQSSIEVLVSTASEAPKVSAELINQLQAGTQRNLVRDNELLAERTALMQELSVLSEGLRASTALQQQVMEQLLEKSGNQILELSVNVSEQLGQCGEQLAGTALELSELGSGFGNAVETFKVSNESMRQALSDVTGALSGAGERSNEQLAYYVAQARDIIDHNLMTQQVILEKLESVTDAMVAR